MSTAVRNPAPTSQQKRSDQSQQFKLLQLALGDVVIDPALPYASQVARVLRAAILSLRLMPGTPLSEIVIAEALGLSRTPIREALKDLSAEQLLDIYPQAGTVVAPIRLRLVEQGAFVRSAIESANLVDLVKVLDSVGQQRIQSLLDRQAHALSKFDRAQFFVFDEAMHQLFFELTDRLPIWDIVQQCKQHVDRARQLLIRDDQESIHRAYGQHLKITGALFAGEAARVVLEMQQHVMQIPQAVLEYASKMESNLIVK